MYIYKIYITTIRKENIGLIENYIENIKLEIICKYKEKNQGKKIRSA